MTRRVIRLFVTPLPALIIAGILALSGGAVAAVGYTSQPAFCSTCHEMTPYYQAWRVGPHKNVSCVACHVDPGAVAQASHKVVALKEVYDHVATKPTFPSGSVDVPNARCLACHRDLPAVTKSGFQHAKHVNRATCVSCHPDAGHTVSPQALATAGILKKSPVTVQSTSSAESTESLHVTVTCNRCHSLATTRCGMCHRSPHAPRGECATCHRPGTTWVFAHPASTACTTCHQAPAKHFGADCTRCHVPTTPFAKTVFAHDASATACASCHPAPAKHFKLACTTCHSPGTPFAKTVYNHSASPGCTECHAKPPNHVATNAACATCHRDLGKDWKFAHPASTACSDCHDKPKGHVKGTCSSCHSPGVAFKATSFTHRSTTCQSCHNAPSGHRTSGCSSCHKQAGRSWAFSHPGRTDCASCHSRPRSHFTGSCTNCHRVGVAFARTAFRHSTSTSCQSCHKAPSGHKTSGCATCHKQAGRSWSFTHPGSTSCSSCHKAPSSHYGTSCATCHKQPGRSWSFSHGSIPGGEHTYKTWACVKCHPSGYSSHSCTCHGGGSGPSGD